MVQSVELLLDETSDAVVRRQWERLAAAGLPSQAHHAGASNAPHVTLAARAQIDIRYETDVSVAVSGLPMPLRLGALACFGRSRFVLVRLVVVHPDLLALHAAVAGVLGPDPDDHAGTGNLAPGRWTPHVTLGRRLSAAEVGEALTVLGGMAELDGSAVRCRRWDGEAKREWAV